MTSRDHQANEGIGGVSDSGKGRLMIRLSLYQGRIRLIDLGVPESRKAAVDR